MLKDEPVPSTVTVTLILRNECGACVNLLKQLEPFSAQGDVILNHVNLTTDDLPTFAQGVIVPATYIGDKLWRHGVYSAARLNQRIQAERNQIGPTAN